MKFVDMAMSKEEAVEYNNPIANPDKMPKYPYGLCISLCKDELEKLELNASEIDVGEMLHLHAMARVTSKSVNQTEDGEENPRIELVMAFLEIEDEDAENKEENRVTPAKKLSKLYR